MTLKLIRIVRGPSAPADARLPDDWELAIFDEAERRPELEGFRVWEGPRVDGAITRFITLYRPEFEKKQASVCVTFSSGETADLTPDLIKERAHVAVETMLRNIPDEWKVLIPAPLDTPGE